MKRLIILCATVLFSLNVFSAVRHCVIDSVSYSKYPAEGYQVPLVDGAVVTIDMTDSQLNSVYVNNTQFFKSCEKELITFENSEMAKNAFQYTGETTFDHFVGSKMGLCKTVDEGWLVVIGDRGSYMAYMGPYEVPISLVQMNCN